MKREKVGHSFVTQRQHQNDTRSCKWNVKIRRKTEWLYADHDNIEQLGMRGCPTEKATAAMTCITKGNVRTWLHFCFLSTWVKRNKMKGSEMYWLEMQRDRILSSFMWTLNSNFFLFFSSLFALTTLWREMTRLKNGELKLGINMDQCILLE